MKRSDWGAWQQAQYRILNNYSEQNMFSEPMEAPTNVNVKICDTQKAQMVCDGALRQGTITLGYTFANSLDAASERLFWALVAQKNLKAYGADCSNTFAEV